MSAAPQEFPDRVGFKPDGTKEFTPYIPPETILPELTSGR